MTSSLSSYLELRPCRPRVERLKSLLAECPFQGTEYEPELVGEEESQGGGEGEEDSAPLYPLPLEDEGPEGGKGRPRGKRKQRTPRKVRAVIMYIHT